MATKAAPCSGVATSVEADAVVRGVSSIDACLAKLAQPALVTGVAPRQDGAMMSVAMRVRNGTPYECGVETEGDAWGQFNVRYYVVALLFVVFDVEVVFLYPWAVAFRQLGLFAFVEAALFLVVLLVGYVYAWRRKALEWV